MKVDDKELGVSQVALVLLMLKDSAMILFPLPSSTLHVCRVRLPDHNTPL